jgi:hypothetical protein
MRRRQLTPAAIAAALLLTGAVADAQRRGAATPRRGGPPAEPARKIAPMVTCPSPLGTGVKTRLAFCDVLTSRIPAEGILIPLPPHAGPVTLTFDLHNRQTYSEEQVQARRAFARYTATIGVLTADNTLITRAAVQSEFRTAADLIDRVGGGAGPGGLKAVAPTGVAHVTVTIPEAENQVSLLGEKLMVERLDGSATYSALGRPIAVVSNIMIEYRPAPERPAARGRATRP